MEHGNRNRMRFYTDTNDNVYQVEFSANHPEAKRIIAGKIIATQDTGPSAVKFFHIHPNGTARIFDNSKIIDEKYSNLPGRKILLDEIFQDAVPTGKLLIQDTSRYGKSLNELEIESVRLKNPSLSDAVRVIAAAQQNKDIFVRCERVVKNNGKKEITSNYGFVPSYFNKQNALMRRMEAIEIIVASELSRREKNINVEVTLVKF